MTRRERIRYWRAENRRKAVYRRAGAKLFDTAFDRQIAPLMDAIEASSDIRDIELPPLDNTGIEEAYQQLYVSAGLAFAQDRKRRIEAGKATDDIFDDLITEEMRKYLERWSGITITAVGDTSKQILSDLIKEITREMLDDEGTVTTAITAFRDRLESEWHKAKRYRIERIVRTEVNRASNYGAMRGAAITAEQMGVTLEKVWLSAFTGESRQTHKEASGQTVGLNESFTVGGEKLSYPGDPAGSPGNTINCLCSVFERRIK